MVSDMNSIEVSDSFDDFFPDYYVQRRIITITGG